MFKTLYRTFLIIGVLAIVGILFLSYLNEKEQLKIQKEQHILGLYTTYKSNIDTCTSIAKQAGKDDQFINENCVKEINNSLVGKALINWGKSELLVK